MRLQKVKAFKNLNPTLIIFSICFRLYRRIRSKNQDQLAEHAPASNFGPRGLQDPSGKHVSSHSLSTNKLHNTRMYHIPTQLLP